MKTVSVIIPVYNTEKYLEECIKSIIKQTYNNIEILLIDNGSTDSSPKICDFYADKYDNIKSFHIKNNGVSNARNYGIKKSIGHYISFIDSDDYIDINMIEEMIKDIEINKTDMSVCNYKLKYQNSTVESKFPQKQVISSDLAIKELYKTNSIQGFSVNKIYKREIIIKNKLSFNENVKMCEDMLFVFQYLMHCKNISIIDHVNYYYRMRMSSASNLNNEKDLSLFYVYELMVKENPKVKEYIRETYYLSFFKYYKELKRTNKIDNIKQINYFSLIKNKKIEFKTKVYCTYYLIVPIKIRLLFKKMKYLKRKYFD